MRPLPIRFLILLLLLIVPARALGQLNESERKAAARAAYTEGVKLQEEGKPAEALGRFEAAQKLFDAPTHLLRIAQCQAATGKLVEAQETYETLVRKNLGATPPEAFADAQKKAENELKELRPRVPTLRLTVKPDPSTLKNLQVTVNGSPVPNELLAIARPVNPGTYRVNAGATGYKLAAPIDVTLAEREQKAQELQLVVGQPPPVVVAPPPVPPPYATTAPPPPAYQPQPGAPVATAEPPKPQGPSSWGLLLGAHLGLYIPGGGVAGGTSTSVRGVTIARGQDINFDAVASAGGGGGLGAMLRFAKIFLVGGTLDFAQLGEAKVQDASGVLVSTSKASTTYGGLTLGIVPNVDKASFYGELGVGRRSLSRSISYSTAALGTQTAQETLGATEFQAGIGLMIPVGPVRLLPKASLTVGSFKSSVSGCDRAVVAQCVGDGDIADTATHTIFFVGVGGYYHLDLGKK